MKLKLIIFLVFFSIENYAQISVAPRHIGPSGKFKKGVLKEFKNTETIFLLSNIFSREEYENILKDSWTVTPYKIVEPHELNLEDFYSGKYSIAQMSGFKRIGKSTSLFVYVDLKTYDSEAITKKLSKLSEKKREKKMQEILDDNSNNIARFYLFPKDDFIRTIYKPMNEIVISLFTEDVFFNYKPGFLKNYFQKMNNLLEDEEISWMYSKDYLPELKKLKSNKLYIPSYLTTKYQGMYGSDSEEGNERIEKLFKNYSYEYEIIDTDLLSEKIMNKEALYYIRYVRMNAERFIQVVNSITGEIIYRDYMTGMSYNIKPKHINEINNKINKAVKKK